MIRTLGCLLGAIVLGTTLTAAHAATDYTDTWWNPAEPGWGINLTQQNHFVFGTFYLYAPDGKATWFTAQMLRDGTADRFSGPLYRVQGTWFGAPVWQGNQIAQSGTATFTATSAYEGTLAYSVDGLQITRNVQRQTLVPVSIAGSYRGAVAGTRSGCESNGKFTDFVDLEVLHSPATGTLRISQYSASTGRLVCRMEGTAIQSGKLLLADGASYSCPDTGWDKPARIYNIRPTTAGFEAQWFSDGGNGCSENGDMSGVFYR